MLRVTSLAKMDDRQLNKWIKRLALLLVAGTVVFTGVLHLRSLASGHRRRSWIAASPRWSRPSATTPRTSSSRGQLADTLRRQGPLRGGDCPIQPDPRDRQGNRARHVRPRAAPTWASASSTPQPRTTRPWWTLPRAARWRTSTRCSRPPTLSLGSGRDAAGQAGRRDPPARDGPQDQALRCRRPLPDRNGVRCRSARPTRPTAVVRSAVAFVPIGWSEPYTAMADGLHEGRQGRRWPSGPGRWPTWPPASRSSPNRACSRSWTAKRPWTPQDRPWAPLQRRRATPPRPGEWYGTALGLSPDNAAARLGDEPGRRRTLRPAGPTDARAGRRGSD